MGSAVRDSQSFSPLPVLSAGRVIHHHLPFPHHERLSSWTTVHTQRLTSTTSGARRGLRCSPTSGTQASAASVPTTHCRMGTRSSFWQFVRRGLQADWARRVARTHAAAGSSRARAAAAAARSAGHCAVLRRRLGVQIHTKAARTENAAAKLLGGA
ncbi:hypothetical protein PYCCODRAFT_1439435 [Trametes coccinea BRFM310]|uniref:Uncharacterized protein n=1 Tax=Trametes coccinea (strain BRFM310) TaxID=1353009 RepID=A0A1Y2IAW3_TRAC3|nr:hypothetical protein PYCCODRAFT_1439435 [Trametes coccinea BRFM310]